MRTIYAFIIFVAIATNSILASNTLTSARIDNNALLLNFAGPLVTNRVTHFKIPAGQGSKLVFDFDDMLLRNDRLDRLLKHQQVWKFRIYRYKKGIIRVTIDTKKGYNLKHGMIASNKYRIDLPEAIKPKRVPRKPLPKPITSSIGSSTIIADSVPQSQSWQSTSTAPRPKKRYTIVVDAGHGGKDSGALGGSRQYMEKIVVLKIAKRLRYHLKKLGFDVQMTRSNDRYITLGRRTRFANGKKADAFISVHANATVRSKAKRAMGIETYFLQVTRNARAERVASRENSVVRNQKNKMTKDVMLKLVNGPKIELSNKMAIDVQKGMLGNVQRKYKYIKDNGVRSAPFWVLVGAQMPSVLVEVGYITHPVEKKRLMSPKYQDAIAKGMAEGISTYFANREKELE